jgi:hypothetical protein
MDNADYTPMIEGCMIAGFREESGPVTHAGDVAAAVWRAAVDPTPRSGSRRVKTRSSGWPRPGRRNRRLYPGHTNGCFYPCAAIVCMIVPRCLLAERLLTERSRQGSADRWRRYASIYHRMIRDDPADRLVNGSRFSAGLDGRKPESGLVMLRPGLRIPRVEA